MSNSSDAAEQVVRLSLEGVEVAAKITGEAARDIAGLLIAALKNPKSSKTKGKTRLTKMLKSGKELKVFSISQKDLEKFTRNAKKYGVLYTVLRDKTSTDKTAEVDIIARAEDSSKIQRIIERFGLNLTDDEKATIVNESEKELSERKAKEKDKPEKSKADLITEKALGKPIQREENERENPSSATTEKDPLSEPKSSNMQKPRTLTDKGAAKESVREKIDHYRVQIKKQKEQQRALDIEVDEPKKTTPKVIEHKQPEIKVKNSKTER